MAKSNTSFIPLGQVKNNGPPNSLLATVVACEWHREIVLGAAPDGPQSNDNQEPPPTVSAADREQQHQHPRWTFQPYAVEMANNPIMAWGEMAMKQVEEDHLRRRRLRG